MNQHKPATAVWDEWAFGEFGEVNPSISDGATFTFLSSKTMAERFSTDIEGCYLYARHFNPSNRYLADALARMENAESAHVTASGMAAIACALLELCSAGDTIVSDRTIYGGTFALFKNYLPRLGINVVFVNMQNLAEVQSAVQKHRPKAVYGESMSNPLLSILDIPAVAKVAHENGAKLVVDNTFLPMIVSPLVLGADIVVHSLTKYINGSGDCVGGAICANKEFISKLSDVNYGSCMLLGPVLDSLRSASLLKNLHTLHLRLSKHAENALFLANRLNEIGLKARYPGLKNHPHHQRLCQFANAGFGFGGMLVVDFGSRVAAEKLLEALQHAKFGFLAVSLGYFRTLFSVPASSTSSEIPEVERQQIGLSEGLVRFSVGIDQDMNLSWQRMQHCLKEVGLLS